MNSTVNRAIKDDKASTLKVAGLLTIVLATMFVLSISGLFNQAFADEVSNSTTLNDAKGASGTMSPRNTADWPLDLYLSSTNTWGSQIREKDTFSSVYAYITSNNPRAMIYIEGWNKYDQNPDWHADCTYGWCWLDHAAKYEIYNNVRENEFYSAQITAWDSEGHGNNISGVWSPDYAPEYGVELLNQW